MSKVSVIIPAFNAGMFIERSVTSVLKQSYEGEVEVIVVDDASTDHTRETVATLARRQPQIVLLANERGKGPSGARNTGLLRATGDYVAFLDADDLWLPGHLAAGVGFLEKQRAVDVVFFNFDLIDLQTGERIGDWFSRHSFADALQVEALADGHFLITDDMLNSLIDESFIHLQSMLVRRRTLIGILFNESVSRSEDRDFCIRLHLFANARFAYRNVVTSVYFRHAGSLTSEAPEKELAMILDQITIFSGYLTTYRLDAATAAKLRKILFERLLVASYLYRKAGSYRQAVAALGRSFSYGIDISQGAELAKIAVSFLLGDALPRRRGST